MHIETLARRLAEKSNTPILEQVVLGEADLSVLPPVCMLWTGAVLGAPRKTGKIFRDRQNRVDLRPVMERPYGVINWQGKRISVARLIFLLTQKPDYEFRMVNQCQVPRCINPFHFEITEINLDPVPEPDLEEFDIGDGEEELEELIEILLLDYEPTCWADVEQAELLEGMPHDAIRKLLREMGKDHLT